MLFQVSDSRGSDDQGFPSNTEPSVRLHRHLARVDALQVQVASGRQLHAAGLHEHVPEGEQVFLDDEVCAHMS